MLARKPVAIMATPFAMANRISLGARDERIEYRYSIAGVVKSHCIYLITMSRRPFTSTNIGENEEAMSPYEITGIPLITSAM